jgi:hypothetical protein
MDGNRFDITREFNELLSRLIDFVPNLIGALLILIIGYWIAAMVGRLVTRGLRRLRFDRTVHTSAVGNSISRIIDSPSQFAGNVAFWLLFLGVISLAVSTLNLPVLNQLLGSIYSYVPNVIAAIAIFLVAGAVSTAAVTFVQNALGRTALAKIIAAVIPAITMSLAVFMILNQLGIARDIVNILFTALVGSVALGLALAFGLGGQEVARDLLQQAATKARENKDAVAAEARQAARNAKRDS